MRLPLAASTGGRQTAGVSLTGGVTVRPLLRATKPNTRRRTTPAPGVATIMNATPMTPCGTLQPALLGEADEGDRQDAGQPAAVGVSFVDDDFGAATVLGGSGLGAPTFVR